MAAEQRAIQRTITAEQRAQDDARELEAAQQRWREAAPDRARRRGGYFLSSNRVPVDSEGRVIPEAEWQPEHAADVRARYPHTPVEAIPLTVANGADLFQPDGGKMPGLVQGRPLQGIQPKPAA